MYKEPMTMDTNNSQGPYQGKEYAMHSGFHSRGITITLQKCIFTVTVTVKKTNFVSPRLNHTMENGKSTT